MSDQEHDWATVPLLDQANVGKYVWVDWNGNRKEPTQIQKIGRTNIHCGPAWRTSSYRVEPTGDHANGMASGFSIHCQSNQYKIDQEERFELVKVFVKQSDTLVRSGSLERLRWVVALLNGEAVV